MTSGEAVMTHTTDPSDAILVVGEGSLDDDAIAALIERLGFSTIILPPGCTDIPATRAAVVRTPSAIHRIRSGHRSRTTPIMLISNRDGDLRKNPMWLRDPGIVHLDTRSTRATHQLQSYLNGLARNRERVHVTDRELQIMRTYTLGATLQETANVHKIAESTVREHYRRVSRRYEAAGRPIGNKAQMLLALLADGWLDQSEVRASA